MPRSPASDRRALAGIGLTLLGIFLFSANDAMGKWLVTTYTVGQVLLLRSLAALIVLAPLLARDGWASVRVAERPGLHLARVVFGTAETACFYWAVAHLPLADVMTYWLAAPVYVVAASALLLGEPVGVRRWIGVAAGFAGVLVALGPSGGMVSPAAVVSLVGSVLFALFVLATRRLRGAGTTTLVAFQMVGGLVLGAALAPVGWVTPGLRDLVLLLLLGIVAMVAHLCVTRALALAPAPVVVPYQYTFLVWAVVFGYVVFGDVPDIGGLVGAGIICAAGLYLAALERTA
ncbi:MAG TPA: DMT family transporter [Thermodesulfobacteriota bacterium]